MLSKNDIDLMTPDDRAYLLEAQAHLIDAWRTAFKRVSASQDLASACKIADEALEGRE